MLLFTILLFVLHTQAFNVQSVNALHTQVTMSKSEELKKAHVLLGVARRDPKAFAEMFDRADPEKVQQIISLLEALITAAQAEILELQATVDHSNEQLGEASSNLDSKRGECFSIKVSLQDSIIVENEAKGAMEEKRVTYSTAEPELNNEIETLQGIVKILIEMKNAQSFLGKKDQAPNNTVQSVKQNIKAFLGSVVDADPAALEEIVALLEGLVQDAKDQLALLKSKLEEAEESFATAEKTVDEKEGEKITCDEEEVGSEKEKEEAEGVFNAATQDQEVRNPVLEAEIDTLKKVIKILKSML